MMRRINLAAEMKLMMPRFSRMARIAGLMFFLVVTVDTAMAQNQSQTAAPKIVKLGTYGDWQHQCIEQPSGGRECFLSQIGVSKAAGVRALMTIVKTAEGYGTRFEVPIGVFLPAGLGLTVDGKDYGVALFERCFPDRCIAFADLKPETIQVLKRGKVTTLIVYSDPKNRIFLPISLKGMTAAFRSLG
jgi:invasion protein IalB